VGNLHVITVKKYRCPHDKDNILRLSIAYLTLSELRDFAENESLVTDGVIVVTAR